MKWITLLANFGILAGIMVFAKRLSWPIWAGALLAAIAPVQASLLVNVPTGVDGSSLNVSTLASGLSYPYSMQALSNGSLLVGVSNPGSNGDYLFAQGGVVQIAPDGTQTTVFSGLPYPTQGIRKISDNLYAVSQAGVGATQITFLAPAANPGDSLKVVGTIDFSPSNAGQPFNTTIATRPTPGQSGSYDLFFSTGGDMDHAQSSNFATLSGLITGTVAYNTVSKVTVTPSGGAPIVSGLQEIAKGVRNTAGIVFDSAGNLYLDDNGWDVPGTNTPQNADELNFLAASAIGSGIADFGFPNNYVEYGTGNIIGGQGILPLAAFQPLNGMQSLGIAEMALAPVNFPVGLNNGLFLSFYGKWEQGGANNTTGPLLYYDFGTGTYSDFIPSGQMGIGHLASLTSTADALYIGDMNAYGTVRQGPINGAIYEIQSSAATPEPKPLWVLPSCLALFGLLRIRRTATNL